MEFFVLSNNIYLSSEAELQGGREGGRMRMRKEVWGAWVVGARGVRGAGSAASRSEGVWYW